MNGIEGIVVDVVLADEWTGSCPDTDVPVAILLTSGTEAGGEYEWGSAQGLRSRYIFLDVSGDWPVFIDIEAPTDEFDEFLPQAMEVVQTFEFN